MQNGYAEMHCGKEVAGLTKYLVDRIIVVVPLSVSLEAGSWTSGFSVTAVKVGFTQCTVDS